MTQTENEDSGDCIDCNFDYTGRLRESAENAEKRLDEFYLQEHRLDVDVHRLGRESIAHLNIADSM